MGHPIFEARKASLLTLVTAESCRGLILRCLAMLVVFQANAVVLGNGISKAGSIGNRMLASAAGAALDSDLQHGGGTDDTDVLQRILNKAQKVSPIHLIVDGVALVSGLYVYGNTTIECLEGGGLYLKDGANRAIIRNAHRSRDAITDQHITIRGCFLNGNRDHQGRENNFGLYETDGSFIVGLQFLGVNYLTIENTTLWHVRTFASHIANANRIAIRNVIVDNGTMELANTDGFHFNGPIRYLTIEGMKLRTFDDGLSLCANDAGVDDLRIKNDMGPYVGQGPITDVVVNNVEFMDAFFGIRLLSSTQRLDRVVINNVVGTVQAKLAIISHFANPGLGDFGSITFNNVHVDPISPFYAIPDEILSSGEVRALEWGGAGGSLFVLNGHMENLNLQNIVTKPIDTRPLVRFGPDSDVEVMNLDLKVYDHDLRSTPIQLSKGSRIRWANFSLDWKGAAVDQGGTSVVSYGGTVEQLLWINTPPMFVSAVLKPGSTIVVVKFNQSVKSNDYKRGVTIKVNGKSVRIRDASREQGDDSVDYVVTSDLRLSDTITWEYRAEEGSLQNLNGNHLLSVEPKSVNGPYAGHLTLGQ